MKKPVIYTELCYLVGIVSLALGAALMVCADFGMSVVVSPAYLLHLKISEIWPGFTFGIAEYCMQGTLLLLLILVVRRFHWSYLFSFATALLYGFALDRLLPLVLSLPSTALWQRIIVYLVGLFFCALGVSLVLHTYISPEVYELFIREFSSKYAISIGKVKTVYDCSSCLLAILLSFAFYGLFHFRGVGIGTLISALSSGTLTALFGRFWESYFTLKPAFPAAAAVFSPPPFKDKRTSGATSKNNIT